MALFKHGETPSDEPFTRFLSPLDMTSAVTSAIGACWHNMLKHARSAESIMRLAHETFDRVETWWLGLQDRGTRRTSFVESSNVSLPRRRTT
jgi:hypothetical protein